VDVGEQEEAHCRLKAASALRHRITPAPAAGTPASAWGWDDDALTADRWAWFNLKDTSTQARAREGCVSERALEGLTLREKLIEAEKVTRELIDHLERGFLPKVHQLRRLARRGNEPEHQEEITDVSIRSTVDQVLHTDDYTRQLSTRARNLLAAIDKDVTTIFEGQ
jgi:hypothetical protein